MKIFLQLNLIFLLAATAQAQWANVGNGIDYQKFTLADPNNVFVTRMARSNTNSIIGSMIAQNRVAGARETVSSQASRSEDALNSWGGDWGRRNDVVVAINGSFFNTTTGVITGGHIFDGWYAKRFDDWGGQTGFVWKNDRSCFIGGCPHIVAGEQTITLGGVSRNYQGINIVSGVDQLIVYTPQYNNNTLSDGTGVEVLVELPWPLSILNYSGGAAGIIRQVRVAQPAAQIPFAHVVLSGLGTAATFLQNNAQVGQPVKITADVTHYNSDCSTPFGMDFVNSYALAQGNFVFLRDGVIQPTANSGMIIRNPRTFVGYNSSYVFFVVCDGRTTQSLGMTSDEMGAFCLNYLGATDAVNMDGGGSSTMWVNGVVRNNPADGSERTVANGLMMVNLLPKNSSAAFTTGQPVTTSGSANFRLGPGTDYYAFATLASGVQATVLSNRVNGVYANGYYWWNCSSGGTNGWIAESLLSSSNSGPSISLQPVNRVVALAGSASFSILATGSNPLSYQWQKNNTNLNNGGHYSGCLTATLTITGATSNDVASYRCVTSNAFGGATSSSALLTLGISSLSISLTNIPLLAGDLANEARAITPDGVWVAGASGSRGFLHSVSNGAVFNVVSSDGAQSTLLTGVAYRIRNGQREIVLSGLASGWHTDFMTTNGVGFAGKRQDTGLGTTPLNLPIANGLAGTASDVFYSFWWDSNSNIQERIGRLSGAWPMAPVYDVKGISKDIGAGMHGISSGGRAVGWRQLAIGGQRNNYLLDWNGLGTPASLVFNGLDGTTAGEAFAVSADGLTVFGASPITGAGTTTYGYKITNPGGSQSIGQLPNFPDALGSTVLAVPYGCTADGKFAVGTSFRGIEKAVLWDTSASNPGDWRIVDLTDVAAAKGELDVFVRLSRAYGVGTNSVGAIVVTGVGLDVNSNTRAFVMSLSPPLAPIAFPPTAMVSGSYPAGFKLTFLSPANANIIYHLEFTANLAQPSTWTEVDAASGNGSLISLSDPNPVGSRRFYRIRVQ